MLEVENIEQMNDSSITTKIKNLKYLAVAPMVPDTGAVSPYNPYGITLSQPSVPSQPTPPSQPSGVVQPIEPPVDNSQINIPDGMDNIVINVDFGSLNDALISANNLLVTISQFPQKIASAIASIPGAVESFVNSIPERVDAFVTSVPTLIDNGVYALQNMTPEMQAGVGIAVGAATAIAVSGGFYLVKKHKYQKLIRSQKTVKNEFEEEKKYGIENEIELEETERKYITQNKIITSTKENQKGKGGAPELELGLR